MYDPTPTERLLIARALLNYATILDERVQSSAAQANVRTKKNLRNLADKMLAGLPFATEPIE